MSLARFSLRSRLKWAALFALVTAASIALPTPANAQRSTRDRSDDEGAITIKPYTGPPIYLEEPEQIAAPTIVRRETIPEKYEDGTLRIEREVAHFSDNHFEADGLYREFHPNGKVFVEGRFRRGRQHGEWTFYFDNGQINRKATYNSGQPDGGWDVYRADGTLSGKRSFRSGLRHGEWINFDESGKKPLREEHYDDGKVDGVWKVWFPNGQLKQQISFRKGTQHGTSTEWNEMGDKTAEVNHVDGKLHGTVTRWLADGTKIVHEYKDGRLVTPNQ